jgi:hypothetical protein
MGPNEKARRFRGESSRQVSVLTSAAEEVPRPLPDAVLQPDLKNRASGFPWPQSVFRGGPVPNPRWGVGMSYKNSRAVGQLFIPPAPERLSK